MYIDMINSPDDIKKMDIDTLNKLPQEMRDLIIRRVNTIGGHLAPNLGIIEATIALHYVFNSPYDKFVFDISHQCYTHKMITGRKEAFTDTDKFFKYSGYTSPEESEHDLFTIGHTSTSVSLATGVAKARDLKGEKYNVIALIGDGSLSGGEALEGLDNAATLNSNIIIVVNDNEMSIAENHGGLYDNLKLLRETNGQAECNFFKALGFKYHYLDEGNNIEKLIETFKAVKDTNCPTVVHIHTVKGNGLKLAEDNKEFCHFIMPHDLDTDCQFRFSNVESYNSITTEYLKQKAKEDKSLIVVNAATPGVFGFFPQYRNELGAQYTDVGIAEEHGIAYASALAKSGAKPVMAIMSSFVQRTYDQLSQDLALNSSPMTLLVYWGGISGADVTHLCTFDIPLISNIPNIVYLAPTNKEEYMTMLKYSVEQNERPVAIRVPNCELISSGIADDTDYSILNKFKMVERGSKVAVIGLGNFFHLAKEVKDELKKQFGIEATLINPKFISGVDKEMLDDLKKNHDIVITLEDGIIDGGFGQKVAGYYADSDMKVMIYGADKEFTDRIPVEDLYEKYHLTKELIASDVAKILCINSVK